MAPPAPRRTSAGWGLALALLSRSGAHERDAPLDLALTGDDVGLVAWMDLALHASGGADDLVAVSTPGGGLAAAEVCAGYGAAAISADAAGWVPNATTTPCETYGARGWPVARCAAGACDETFSGAVVWMPVAFDELVFVARRDSDLAACVEAGGGLDREGLRGALCGGNGTWLDAAAGPSSKDGCAALLAATPLRLAGGRDPASGPTRVLTQALGCAPRAHDDTWVAAGAGERAVDVFAAALQSPGAVGVVGAAAAAVWSQAVVPLTVAGGGNATGAPWLARTVRLGVLESALDACADAWSPACVATDALLGDGALHHLSNMFFTRPSAADRAASRAYAGIGAAPAGRIPATDRDSVDHHGSRGRGARVDFSRLDDFAPLALDGSPAVLPAVEALAKLWTAADDHVAAAFLGSRGSTAGLAAVCDRRVAGAALARAPIAGVEVEAAGDDGALECVAGARSDVWETEALCSGKGCAFRNEQAAQAHAAAFPGCGYGEREPGAADRLERVALATATLGRAPFVVVARAGGAAAACLGGGAAARRLRGGDGGAPPAAIATSQLRWALSAYGEARLYLDGVDVADVAPFNDGDGRAEWSDLGGDACAEAPIAVHGPDAADSGAADDFASAVLRRDDERLRDDAYAAHVDPADVLAAVAADGGALGLVPAAAAAPGLASGALVAVDVVKAHARGPAADAADAPRAAFGAPLVFALRDEPGAWRAAGDAIAWALDDDGRAALRAAGVEPADGDGAAAAAALVCDAMARHGFEPLRPVDCGAADAASSDARGVDVAAAAVAAAVVLAASLAAAAFSFVTRRRRPLPSKDKEFGGSAQDWSAKGELSLLTCARPRSIVLVRGSGSGDLGGDLANLSKELRAVMRCAKAMNVRIVECENLADLDDCLHAATRWPAGDFPEGVATRIWIHLAGHGCANHLFGDRVAGPTGESAKPLVAESVQRVVATISRYRDEVEVVVCNSCQSSTLAGAIAGAGLSAIGWRTECTDHGAALFAAAFYATAFREEPRGSLSAERAAFLNAKAFLLAPRDAALAVVPAADVPARYATRVLGVARDGRDELVVVDGDSPDHSASELSSDAGDPGPAWHFASSGAPSPGASTGGGSGLSSPDHLPSELSSDYSDHPCWPYRSRLDPNAARRGDDDAAGPYESSSNDGDSASHAGSHDDAPAPVVAADRAPAAKRRLDDAPRAVSLAPAVAARYSFVDPRAAHVDRATGRERVRDVDGSVFVQTMEEVDDFEFLSCLLEIDAAPCFKKVKCEADRFQERKEAPPADDAPPPPPPSPERAADRAAPAAPPPHREGGSGSGVRVTAVPPPAYAGPPPPRREAPRAAAAPAAPSAAAAPPDYAAAPRRAYDDYGRYDRGPAPYGYLRDARDHVPPPAHDPYAAPDHATAWARSRAFSDPRQHRVMDHARQRGPVDPAHYYLRAHHGPAYAERRALAPAYYDIVARDRLRDPAAAYAGPVALGVPVLYDVPVCYDYGRPPAPAAHAAPRDRDAYGFDGRGDAARAALDGRASFECAYDGRGPSVDSRSSASSYDGAPPPPPPPPASPRDPLDCPLDRATLQGLGPKKVSRLAAVNIHTVHQLATVDVTNQELVVMATSNRRFDRAVSTLSKWKNEAQQYLERRKQGLEPKEKAFARARPKPPPWAQ